MSKRPSLQGLLAALATLVLCLDASAAEVKTCPPPLQAEMPVIPLSIEQMDINAGTLSFSEISRHGAQLFVAKFNRCDGQGRPETTGGGDKRLLPAFDDIGNGLSAGQIGKLRTSAPDADSCAGCHNDPEIGAGGDFVANVFVLAQARDPVTLSVSPLFSNSRNTLAMHGAGPIEMLAREMTAELQAQRQGLPDGQHTLVSKGVSFDIVIAGNVVIDARGIDRDLVVRPFHQAGKVVSLREFSVNAMNHHHGMQAEERFDLNPEKDLDPDYDNDGVRRELTIGDQTAISLWQAQLSTPTRVMPKEPHRQRQVHYGEAVFTNIGCANCHVPQMTLESRLFVEPNPYNPPGTCRDAFEGCPDYAFDMTRQGDRPRLERGASGTAIVRAFTDLKRHNLCDDPAHPDPIRWFCNEQLAQGRENQGDRNGSEYFLTRKLWDVGNSAPYGHRGDLSTITEAILAHGGEARAARDQFAFSGMKEQKAVVTFLKTLQIRTDTSGG